MKIRPHPTLSLVALLTLGFGPHASAGIFSNNFDMLVVAERQDGSPSSQDGSLSYVAFDGGYIEGGDPIAGDTPPTADQVSQSLRSALANQGFQASDISPAVVLTYHWGVLRTDHRQIRVPYGIKANLVARIELVSTRQLSAELENHIVSGEKGGTLNPDASSPRILVGPLDTAREDARQPRIFVIVSAYSYQGLLHREAKLLWRTKMSTREQSGEMDEVIPALIAVGSPYFGKQLTDVQNVEATPRAAAASAAGTSTGGSPESLRLDKQFIDGLLNSEHENFSGVSGGVQG